MKQVPVSLKLTGIFLFCGIIAATALGLGKQSESAAANALTPQQQHGYDIWFKSTFGGERFFSLILPQPPFNLPIGIAQLLTSNRDTRFTDWGVLNDPDCTAGDATTGMLDRCSDPNASGVVGIRKFASVLRCSSASPAHPVTPAWTRAIRQPTRIIPSGRTSMRRSGISTFRLANFLAPTCRRMTRAIRCFTPGRPAR